MSIKQICIIIALIMCILLLFLLPALLFSCNISCVPCFDSNSIIIESKNANITGVGLKYGNFDLIDKESQRIIYEVKETGTEYIPVEYEDVENNSQVLIFEIVISSSRDSITIAKNDEFGMQLDFSAY